MPVFDENNVGIWRCAVRGWTSGSENTSKRESLKKRETPIAVYLHLMPQSCASNWALFLWHYRPRGIKREAWGARLGICWLKQKTRLSGDKERNSWDFCFTNLKSVKDLLPSNFWHLQILNLIFSGVKNWSNLCIIQFGKSGDQWFLQWSHLRTQRRPVEINWKGCRHIPSEISSAIQTQSTHLGPRLSRQAKSKQQKPALFSNLKLTWLPDAREGRRKLSD